MIAGHGIKPDPDAIRVFVETVFSYCEGYIALRAFPERGSPNQPPRLEWIAAREQAARRTLKFAERAAQSGLACYVIPGTVAQGKGGSGDVLQMQTVLVDLDEGDVQAKLQHLVQHLGSPTLVVESGGRTRDGQPRLHVWWRLKEPAEGGEVARLCRLRKHIALKVGADPSFGSPHQPIRTAGSVYLKGGAARHVSIREHISQAEYELSDLLEWADAMPTMAGINDPRQPTVPQLKTSIPEVLCRTVRAGGVDGTTRFESLSRAIGYFIRRCRDGHISAERMWQEISNYNLARVDPPWPEEELQDEVRRLWRRDTERNGATRASPDKPAPVAFTEDALATQFAMKFGDNWRYVANWGQWLEWNGTVWTRDTTLKVFEFAREVCRAAAVASQSASVRTKLSRAGTVWAVERLARADRAHAATTDVWDSDPWALNTPSGLVDLRTGTVKSHDRSQAVTKITKASVGAECPTWRRFLATVTGEDAELQAYLQRVVGYCLAGLTTEHALFFLYGTGANGKSVFVNTISAVLGDYAAVAPMDLFMATVGERHPTEMAGLRGARLVTATETEQGRRWAESKVKALTGGDKIPARFMRQDFFEFVPQFKLVIAGNHKPAIRNIDEAMRRRMHLIPFTVTIPPGSRDKRMQEKLLAECDGILAWAVEGCLAWQQQGLEAPAAVLAATEEYFETEDAVGRWLEERCELGPNYETSTTELFVSWKLWADANGEFPGSVKRFSENLKTRHFAQMRGHRARGFRGVRPRSAA